MVNYFHKNNLLKTSLKDKIRFLAYMYLDQAR